MPLVISTTAEREIVVLRLKCLSGTLLGIRVSRTLNWKFNSYLSPWRTFARELREFFSARAIKARGDSSFLRWRFSAVESDMALETGDEPISLPCELLSPFH